MTDRELYLKLTRGIAKDVNRTVAQVRAAIQFEGLLNLDWSGNLPVDLPLDHHLEIAKGLETFYSKIKKEAKK